MILFVYKCAVESIWNPRVKVCFHSNLTSLGIPHDKLALVRLPIMNGCHQVPVVFVSQWVGAVSLLVVDFPTSMTLPKTDSLNNLIGLRIKFDEAGEVHVVILSLRSWPSSVLILTLISKSKIAVARFVSDVILIQIRKLNLAIFKNYFRFDFQCCHIELVFNQILIGFFVE